MFLMFLLILISLIIIDNDIKDNVYEIFLGIILLFVLIILS